MSVQEIENKIMHLMQTASWKKMQKRSDAIVARTLEQLRKDSYVDPNLLDEPATI